MYKYTRTYFFIAINHLILLYNIIYHRRRIKQKVLKRNVFSMACVGTQILKPKTSFIHG